MSGTEKPAVNVYKTGRFDQIFLARLASDLSENWSVYANMVQPAGCLAAMM
jgi:hypothetical protein